MDGLKAWLVGALRVGVKGVWSFLLAKVPPLAALLGLLTPDQQSALQAAIAVALAGVVLAGVGAAIDWLGGRTGDSFWARAARRLAAIVMLGLNRWQPVYGKVGAGDLRPAAIDTDVLDARGRPSGVSVSVPVLPQ